MARARLLDVPCCQRRSGRGGPAVGLDLQPQFHWPAGTAGADPSREPGDGGGRCDFRRDRRRQDYGALDAKAVHEAQRHRRSDHAQQYRYGRDHPHRAVGGQFHSRHAGKMGVRLVALPAGRIGKPRLHPEPRALSRRGSPHYRSKLRLRVVARRRGVVASGARDSRHHRLGLWRYLFRQLLPERHPAYRCRQTDCRRARHGSGAQPGRGPGLDRSGRADDHLAIGKGTSFRDRSAPPRGPSKGPRRGRTDAATRQRNSRLSIRRSGRAALDSFRNGFCKGPRMSASSNMIKVAVVGGEGIGPEVTAQSRRILGWFATRRGVPMTLREAQYGLIPYLATGQVLPEDTAEAMDEADAILWGATGGPETKEVPAEARKAGGLLSLRQKFDLYANLRPIRANPALSESSPLK